GQRIVKMDELRSVLEEAAFDDVRTLLASGNIMFKSSADNPSELVSKIEERLELTFGFEITVIVRSSGQIRSLVESAPFAEFEERNDVKPYVSFMADKPTSHLRLPYEPPSGGFRLLRICESDVLSVVFPSQQGRSGDAMKLLEKEFGPKITTRNWKTVLKIYDRLGDTDPGEE
ncbi:MAG: DUF1697 domain-containing protein, partial [Candidatus Binatia bacterium]